MQRPASTELIAEVIVEEIPGRLTRDVGIRMAAAVTTNIIVATMAM